MLIDDAKSPRSTAKGDLRASATAHSIKVTRNSKGKWCTQQFIILVHVFHVPEIMSLDSAITCNFGASAPYIVYEKNLLTYRFPGTGVHGK